MPLAWLCRQPWGRLIDHDLRRGTLNAATGDMDAHAGTPQSVLILAVAGVASVTATLASVIPAAPFLEGGCSPSPPPELPRDPAPRDAASCPLALSDAYGVACRFDGLSCPFELRCGATTELVSCTCQDARWRCEGPALGADGAPECLDMGEPESSACPPSLHAAAGRACPRIGRLCFFEGVRCPNGLTMLDDCECRRPDASALLYVCRRHTCSPPIEPPTP